MQTLRAYYKYALKYDLVAAHVEPTEIAKLLVASADSTLRLGTGGILLAHPIVPGLMAMGHVYIWEQEYLRRPALVRAGANWAIKKWDLKRMTAMIPARHTLSRRIAEAAGFKLEGRMRSAVLYTEGVDDLLVLGYVPQED